MTYHRIMFKLSGEVFGGGQIGVDPNGGRSLAGQVKSVVDTGVQVAIVIGGGNFLRGAELSERGSRIATGPTGLRACWAR